MKAGIYDPYLDTLGGGERYCLTVAEYLLSQGWSVDLFWSKSEKLISKAEKRFSLNLSSLHIVDDIFSSPQTTLFRKFLVTRKYDLIFYLGDGSIPFLFSKNNLLHQQVPFQSNFSFFQNILNRLKGLLIHRIIFNSKFTKKHCSHFLKSKSFLLYPPVDSNKFLSVNKRKNIILSVGRFDNILNTKRQDILLKAFRKLIQKHNLKNWQLTFVGGAIDSSSKNKYLQSLKTLSRNLSVEIIVNPDFQTLVGLYSTAKIYWHAAGFGVDEDIHPENTEHFGITIVEAMSAGVAPLALNKGGIPEIIENNKNGFLWNNIDDLVTKTNHLITHPHLLKKISQNARQHSSNFSKDKFIKKFSTLLS